MLEDNIADAWHERAQTVTVSLGDRTKKGHKMAYKATQMMKRDVPGWLPFRLPRRLHESESPLITEMATR